MHNDIHILVANRRTMIDAQTRVKKNILTVCERLFSTATWSQIQSNSFTLPKSKKFSVFPVSTICLNSGLHFGF